MKHLLAVSVLCGLGVPVAGQVQIGNLPDERASGSWGYSVALHGEQALVSSWDEVTVYERVGWSWEEVDRWTRLGSFGANLILREDLAIVSADTAEGLYPWQGKVFEYRKEGRKWTRTRIINREREALGRFGSSMALHGDRLLVGGSGYSPHGKAFLYLREGGEWIKTDSFVPTGGEFFSFGSEVALGEGVGLVSAPVTDGVFVIEPDETGAWGVTTRLEVPLYETARFGTSLACSDGQLFVGASTGDGTPDAQGAVYVFGRTESGWALVQELAPERAGYDMFGWSLDVDGGRLVVGAPGRWPAGQSSEVYVFERSGGIWQQSAVIRRAHYDVFGQQVSLAGDELLVAGHADDGIHWFSFAPEARTLRTLQEGLRPHGGTISFELDAGQDLAGMPYLLLGSASGMTPGFEWQGEHVPLVPDPYLAATLKADPTLLRRNTGVLDANGRARAWLKVAPFGGELEDTDVWHAYLVLDPVTGAVRHVSAPRVLTLLSW